jgi:HAD superfamily hydrolase (TIGR01509 family)
MINVVIPLAGLGSRFAKAGYSLPKPLIPVHGVPMIRLVIDNVRPSGPHRFVFICQRAHTQQFGLRQSLEAWSPGCAVVELDGVTEGAACTVLTAREFIDKHLPVELHDFINDMKQRYTMEIVNANCKPRFNHQYALSMLHAKGYRIAVASNSIRNTIEVMMRYAELDGYLDFIISNEDVTKAKPDPEMYSLAISKLRVQPEECLIVEDNENGIKAARASGAHVLEVDDVTWTNISQKIMEIDAAVAAA